MSGFKSSINLNRNSKPEIWVNGKFLHQPLTGVQRYALGVCHALINQGYTVNLATPPHPIHEIKNARVHTVGKRASPFWEQLELPLYLSKQGNPAFFNLCNSAPLVYRNRITVIHDLAVFEPAKNWFSWQFRTWYRFLLPKVARTGRIATVSEFSQAALAMRFSLPQSEIPICPPGIHWTERAKPISKPKKPYFFLIGSQNPRKGIAEFARAFLATPFATSHDLVLVGTPSNHFPQQSIGDRFHYIEQPSDGEIQSLYTDAELTIFPSYYEGFGLPILESLALNTPVLARRLPVFETVYGRHISYIGANLTASINAALNSVKTPLSTEHFSYKRAAEGLVGLIEN